MYKGIAKVQIEVDQLAGSPAEPQAGPRDRWPRNRTLLKQKQNPLTTLAVCLLEMQNSSKPLTPGNRKFLWPKTPWERLGCFISLATITWSWICQAGYMVRNASTVIRRKGLLWQLNLSTLVTRVQVKLGSFQRAMGFFTQVLETAKLAHNNEVK